MAGRLQVNSWALQASFALDAGTAPGAAAVLAALVVTNPDDTNDGRDEPANSRQEGKGDDSLPLAALVIAAECDVVPLEGTSTGATQELYDNPLVLYLSGGYMRHEKTALHDVVELTLTIKPKAMNHKMEITMSTGQWTKLPEKGNSQIKARKMARPATTSA